MQKNRVEIVKTNISNFIRNDANQANLKKVIARTFAGGAAISGVGVIGFAVEDMMQYGINVDNSTVVVLSTLAMTAGVLVLRNEPWVTRLFRNKEGS